MVFLISGGRIMSVRFCLPARVSVHSGCHESRGGEGECTALARPEMAHGQEDDVTVPAIWDGYWQVRLVSSTCL